MKILFIFTGGTIGSTVFNDKISAEKGDSYVIIEKYREKYGIDFDYDIAEPYTKLSENNTGETLKKLLESVKENLNKDYDGIIVTHGTDTLQYSAAALAYSLGNNCIPVCLVSSNRILGNETANGLFNLHGAICVIKAKFGKGVFVPYKNDKEPLKIHRATRLFQGFAFIDNVYSYGGEMAISEKGKLIKNDNYRENDDEMQPLPIGHLFEQCNGILRLEPYVGMVYPELSEEVKYILSGSFHSGTINTQSDFVAKYFEKAYKKGIKTFITGVTGGLSYESTSQFEKLHITPIKNIAPVAAYIKLWMALGQSENVEKLLNKSLGGDIF